MALMDCKFYSEALGLSCSMYAIVPQETKSQIGMHGTAGPGDHKTLWLLHGMSDDHSIWLRRTSIERYAAPKGIAVIMPAVHRSFYTDMAHGLKYWTFISEELPAIARGFFRLSDRREDNFVAGLSMGGYGSFKLALNRPERFAAAASLSGALDMERIVSESEHRSDISHVFGEVRTIEGTPHDLFHLASRLAEQGGVVPRLYQCCGTEDFLYQDNIRFRDHARNLGLDLTYSEEPAVHEWGYWDRQIAKVLDWMIPGEPDREK